MAGDWTAIEHATISKPEIGQIVASTGRDRHQVLGLMLHFWTWAETMTVDGVINMPQSALPSIIGGDQAFWSAVEAAGWMELPDGRDGHTIKIPRAEHWLTNGAKSRLLNAKRQKRFKEKRMGNALSVTGALPTEQNRTGETRDSEPHGSESSGQVGSDPNRPEPTAREERRSAGPDGRASSAFGTLTALDLKDVARLAVWLRHEQVSSDDPAYREPDLDDLRDVAAAGFHSAKYGRHPLKMFVYMVGRRSYDKINKKTRAASDKAVDEYLKSLK